MKHIETANAGEQVTNFNTLGDGVLAVLEWASRQPDVSVIVVIGSGDGASVVTDQIQQNAHTRKRSSLLWQAAERNGHSIERETVVIRSMEHYPSGHRGRAMSRENVREGLLSELQAIFGNNGNIIPKEIGMRWVHVGSPDEEFKPGSVLPEDLVIRLVRPYDFG